MDRIKNKFESLCKTASDISEHLPTLCKYASECESVLELGVRGCVSSWAFAYGLLKNRNTTARRLFLNDLRPCNINEIIDCARKEAVQIDYEWKNDLELELAGTFDLVFIDTWHVYGQLKRELSKFAPVATKYIVMHDTTVDEIYGETIRNRWDAERQSKETGIPVDEINCGLWRAIEEFLGAHPEWTMHERYFNNNGLTILKRIA